MEHTYVRQTILRGKNIGVVLGCFCPLHQGHLDLILQAKKENDGVIVIVCGQNNEDDDRGVAINLSLMERYLYTRQYFNDDPLVAVYYINDSYLGIAGRMDQWKIWLKQFDEIWKIAISKDSQNANIYWYTGEPEYAKAIEENNHGYSIVVDRTRNPISGTLIRSNPLKYWNQIAYTFRHKFSHNILIAGTASEGKTTLVEDIGKYFGLVYGREYARDYMKKHIIAEEELTEYEYMQFYLGQYELNQSLIRSKENRGIFIADTDTFVTRMYQRYYAKDSVFPNTMEEFNRCKIISDNLIKNTKWDKIFLLEPKGVFVDDGTRYMRHGEMNIRNEMFTDLIKDMTSFGLEDKISILDYGYKDNFLLVKNYIESIMRGAK